MKILKTVFILFLSLSVLSFTTGVKKKNDLERQNFKGKVKTISASAYGKVIMIQNFNKKGFETDESFFDDDTSSNWHRTYTYDKKGNLVEMVQIKGDTSLNLRKTLLYDEKGNNIETREYGSSSFTLNWIEKDKFDATGNMIESETYEPDGTGFVAKHLLKYDTNGNIIEDQNVTSSDKIITKQTFSYDAKGKVTEHNYYKNAYERDTKFTTKYDENGNITDECIYTANDKIKAKYNYTFENKDKAGNWLKMTTWDDNKPVRVLEYKIVYY